MYSTALHLLGIVWRPGTVFFNAGWNEQVFSKSWKKFGADPYCRFWEKRTL